MKRRNQTQINGKDLEPAFELKKRLKEEFPDVGIILYGSIVFHLLRFPILPSL